MPLLHFQSPKTTVFDKFFFWVLSLSSLVYQCEQAHLSTPDTRYKKDRKKDYCVQEIKQEQASVSCASHSQAGCSFGLGITYGKNGTSNRCDSDLPFQSPALAQGTSESQWVWVLEVNEKWTLLIPHHDHSSVSPAPHSFLHLPYLPPSQPSHQKWESVLIEHSFLRPSCKKQEPGW